MEDGTPDILEEKRSLEKLENGSVTDTALTDSDSKDSGCPTANVPAPESEVCQLTNGETDCSDVEQDASTSEDLSEETGPSLPSSVSCRHQYASSETLKGLEDDVCGAPSCPPVATTTATPAVAEGGNKPAAELGAMHRTKENVFETSSETLTGDDGHLGTDAPGVVVGDPQTEPPNAVAQALGEGDTCVRCSGAVTRRHGGGGFSTATRGLSVDTSVAMAARNGNGAGNDTDSLISRTPSCSSTNPPTPSSSDFLKVSSTLQFERLRPHSICPIMTTKI